MAENCNRAFGRYLKTLRERRALSLDDVSSLSQTFPERINKGYLSRCENGHNRLAFSKVIALSRIYEVPADVLVERMELDLEVDRLGGPDTEGMSYSELTLAGKAALDNGSRWDGYALLRDSIPRASVDPFRSVYRDQHEQIVNALMNCATGALGVGRIRFPVHEFTYVEASGKLGLTRRPIVLERLSHCYWRLDQLDHATDLADRAIACAEQQGQLHALGPVYGHRAILAAAEKDHSSAILLYEKSYRAYRRVGETCECARTLNNLAQSYFDLDRTRAARRALAAAEGLLSPQKPQRLLVLGRILLGEIELADNKPDLALRLWREAADMARTLNDRVLRFKAEFFLYRQAREGGNPQVARALERRLRRLSPWLPRDVPELHEFSNLAS